MDTFYAYLGGSLWLTWAIYWAIAAADVKHSRQREPVSSRALHFVPMLLAAALLLLPHFGHQNILFHRLFPASRTASGVGCLLILSGLGFSVWARIHLGRNWSGRITVKDGHELIQTGPYAIVRHPIYTGLLLAIIGSAVAIGELRALLAVALMWVSYQRKLGIEERWMAGAFGAQYKQYQRRTCALIPYRIRRSTQQ